MMSNFFFFSSRRRHTRYIGDWSSDVCSSDLYFMLALRDHLYLWRNPAPDGGVPDYEADTAVALRPYLVRLNADLRSEERRVGKECRSRCASAQHKKQ